MDIKVTFIVPCLNSDETIGACLAHLESCRHPSDDKEIIVVDNGSSDNTLKISQALANKILEDPEASISRLRNLGASAALGDILVFVDSDCLLSTDWLEVALSHLEDSSVGMVGSKTHILPEGSTWVADAWKIHLDYSAKGGDPTWLATRAIAVRKDLFQAIGGFDENRATCEDVTLGHAISKSHKIVVDQKLSPVHLKDASTLPELFNKEVWRGGDSIGTSVDYLKSGRLKLNELISLVLPFYYSFFTAIFFTGLFSYLLGKGVTIALVSALALIVPIVLIAARTALAQKSLSSLPALFLVYLVYVTARTRAVFNGFLGSS